MRALDTTRNYWFQWQWQDLSRIEVSDPDQPDQAKERLAEWRRQGFSPVVVWSTNHPDILELILKWDVGPFGVYIVDEDRFPLVQLLCNPDPELEGLWQRLCKQPVQSVPLGGPSDDSFWVAYGEELNDWLRCIPDRERKELTPKRSFKREEFRKQSADSPTLVLQGFSAAGIGLTHDGAVVSQGAFLSLPRLVGIEHVTGDQLSAAWRVALRTPAQSLPSPPPISAPHLVRRSLRIPPRTGVYSSSSYEAASIDVNQEPSTSHTTFTLFNGAVVNVLLRQDGTLMLDVSSEDTALAGTMLRIAVRDANDPANPKQITEGELVLRQNVKNESLVVAVWERSLPLDEGFTTLAIIETTAGELYIDLKTDDP